MNISWPIPADISFASPEWLWLLVLLPLMVLWYILARRFGMPRMTIPGISMIAGLKPSLRQRAYHGLLVLRLLAVGLLIVSMARPQTSSSNEDVSVEGIDIVMAMDISTSMLAADFKPDRINVAKDVAMEFIANRPHDRIGLVLFSGKSFTQCPLTSEHPVLLNLFEAVRTGLIEDGTAIGDGLATSVNRLRESDAISKVIILLTDGTNNRGQIAPLDAAGIAQTYGIRVYTIGIGSSGLVPYPYDTPFGKQYRQIEVPLDEPLLKDIATITGGTYYKAGSRARLTSIYEEIDKLEKTRIEVSVFSRKHEEFLPFLLAAIGLILVEVLLRFLYFRTIP